MKLKYKKQVSYTSGPPKGWNKIISLIPQTDIYIGSYQEWEVFLYSCFDKPEYIKDIEYVDIGRKVILRAKFWGGPFNENPIKFEFTTDFSKRCYYHQVLNSIIGSISKSFFYYLDINSKGIKIKKMMEAI